MHVVKDAPLRAIPALRTICLDGMIPDIIVVRGAQAGEEIVLPDGSRGIVAAAEQRSVLQIIDVKHASEANASYSAEVALYTYMLVNFLVTAGLDQRFAVSATPLLWTRSSLGASALKNEHGVYFVRKKVPARLQRAVASLGTGPKLKQRFLQRSLRTKNLQQAKISAKPVLIEFAFSSAGLSGSATGTEHPCSARH